MNGGDISRTTFVPTRHYTGVRMQQGRVQLDADWNELVDIERHLGAAAATDAFGPVGMPKAAAGFELTVSPDGADLLMSPGRSWVDGTLCELEAERTAVTVVAGATLTVDAIVLDGVELLRHDWVEIGGDLGSTVARVSAVDTANLTVTVGLAPATETLGAGLGLSRVASYARQPDLPDPPSVTQDGDDPPHLELPAGRFLGYLDVWQRPVTTLEAPALREVALGGPDTTTRSRTVWQLRLLPLAAAPATLSCADDLSPWTSALAEPTGTMAARAELDQVDQNLCTPTVAGGFNGLENQLYRVQVHDVAEDGRPRVVWSRDNGSVVTAWLGVGAGAGQLTVADIGKDSYLGFGAGQWVELTDDVHELSGKPGTLVNLLGAQDNTLTFATTGDNAPTGTTMFTDFRGTPKVRRWDSPGAVPVELDTWLTIEQGVQVRFPAGGTYRAGCYWLVPARPAIGNVVWDKDSAGHPLARRADGVRHAWGRVALLNVNADGVQNIADCRELFPSLTTLMASDVGYAGTACVIPGADTVQDALDQLCRANDLRRHLRLLHGWGIVNGLQVHCAAPRQVTVQPGVAIDPDGNDLELTAAVPVDLVDMVAARLPNVIDEKGNGDVCLVLSTDQELNIGFDVEAYDATQDEPPKLLDGTLWSDFYRDCIQSLHDFLREKLAPGPDDGLASPARQLLSALTNLAMQQVNPQSGEKIFISPTEDKLLQQFYRDLLDRLQSETFCAMFAKARKPPRYPTTWQGMDVIFGAGSHSRLRIRPGANEAYTVGPGSNPLTPTTVINRYDLAKGVLAARIDPVGGVELKAGEKPVGGYGPVTDVAFSPDGRQIYVAVPTSSEDNTLFRVGDMSGSKISWRPQVTLCGVKFVTLATTAADPKSVYAVGLKKVTVNNKVQWQGAGLYQINPDSVNPTMAPMPFPADFNPVGQLAVLPDGRAVATSASQGQEVTSYNSVFQFRLPSPAQPGTQIQLPSSGSDDVCLVGLNVDIALVYTVVSLNGRSVVGNEFGNGALISNGAVQVQKGSGAVRLLPVGEQVAITCADDNVVRLLNSRGGDVSPTFALPLQVGPIAIAAAVEAKRVYVLNFLSNTLWVGERELFDPKVVFPFPDLTAYRKAMIEAFADLLGGFLQYLKDGFFDHFLVNAPSTTGKIYLAAVSIRSKEVYRVCNFSRRHYVKSFPLIGYWLSAVPFMPFLKKWFADLACLVLPEFFGRYDVKAGSESSDRLTVDAIMQAVAWAQSANVPGRLREIRNRTRIVSAAAGRAAQTLRPIAQPVGGTVLAANDLIGKDSGAATQIAVDKGLFVRTRPFEPAVGASSLKNVGNLFRTAHPGDEVTLFTDETGQVRFFDIGDGPAPSVAGPAPDVTTLQNQLIETRGRLDQTLARLTTLQDLQSQRDSEFTELRAQLTALSESQRELRTQVGRDLPPQPGSTP